MLISIIPSEGHMVVDGDARQIDLTDIGEPIHVLRYDSVAKKGMVWYTQESNKGQAILDGFDRYEMYMARWNDAAPSPVVKAPPEPSPQPTAEQIATATRRKSFLDAIVADPQLSQIKALDKDAFDLWWGANVTNATQAIGVLKKLAWILVRQL